jgi:hypothetical protein
VQPTKDLLTSIASAHEKQKIMKIFSLRNKISLALWGALLAILLNLAFYFYSRQGCPQFAFDCSSSTLVAGSPLTFFAYDGTSADLGLLFWMNLINFLFWFLIVSIILTIVRHFKNKK